MSTDAASSQNIRDRFLADHQRIDALLEKLTRAFEANDREDIAQVWNDLEQSLLVHMDAEERFLIPALRQSQESEAVSILNDHQRMRTRLSELGAGIDLHIVRLEAARALADDLRAHARFEDHVYGWAETGLGEPERRSLLSAIMRAARGG